MGNWWRVKSKTMNEWIKPTPPVRNSAFPTYAHSFCGLTYRSFTCYAIQLGFLCSSPISPINIIPRLAFIFPNSMGCIYWVHLSHVKPDWLFGNSTVVTIITFWIYLIPPIFPSETTQKLLHYSHLILTINPFSGAPYYSYFFDEKTKTWEVIFP